MVSSQVEQGTCTAQGSCGAASADDPPLDTSLVT